MNGLCFTFFGDNAIAFSVWRVNIHDAAWETLLLNQHVPDICARAALVIKPLKVVLTRATRLFRPASSDQRGRG